MNVVFDFGGVVFRWEPESFLPRLLPGRGVGAAAARALVDDFFEGFEGDWGAFDSGTLDAEQLAPRIAARTGIAITDVSRAIAAVAGELQPQPAVVDAIQALRQRGHRLWYLSNMPASYALALEAANPLGDWFEGGIFSSRVGVRKPQPEMFALLSSRFDLDPAVSLLIDDSPRNIAAAAALGWQTLHFTGPGACVVTLAGRGLL